MVLSSQNFSNTLERTYSIFFMAHIKSYEYSTFNTCYLLFYFLFSFNFVLSNFKGCLVGSEFQDLLI